MSAVTAEMTMKAGEPPANTAAATWAMIGCW